MKKLTKAEEIQNELYRLFNQYIFNLEGVTLQEGENPPETFLAKSDVVDKCLKVLNEFGENLSKDEDLKR